MEPVTTANRKFNVNQQSKKSLKGDTTYYRLHLSSAHKEAHTTTSDASFNVSGVFPPLIRQDLMDGTWEVFVEEWIAYFASSDPDNTGAYGTYPRFNMKLCLPDMLLSPQDFTTNAVGKAVRDDTVAHVPLDYQFRLLGTAVAIPGAYKDVPVGNTANVLQMPYTLPATELHHVETHMNNVIGADSIGRKVDPHQLMSGKIRVVLKDREHKTIYTAPGAATAGSLIGTDRWQATLLFVHKP